MFISKDAILLVVILVIALTMVGILIFGTYKDGDMTMVGIGVLYVFVILAIGTVHIVEKIECSEEKEQGRRVESNVTEHILEDGSKILIIEGEDGKQEVIEVPK